MRETIDTMAEVLKDTNPDAYKWEHGNKAAGVRIRKAMQQIKNLAQIVRQEILDGKKKETTGRLANLDMDPVQCSGCHRLFGADDVIKFSKDRLEPPMIEEDVPVEGICPYCKGVCCKKKDLDKTV